MRRKKTQLNDLSDISQSEFNSALYNARQILYGKQKRGKKTIFRHPNGTEFADVTFMHKGRERIVMFYRKKGNKNWHFDAMVTG